VIDTEEHSGQPACPTVRFFAVEGVYEQFVALEAYEWRGRNA